MSRINISKIFFKCDVKTSFQILFKMYVVYNRKIDGSPNLVSFIQVSEVVLSIKNGSNDFLQTRYINTFLDVFQTALVIYYRKIRWSPIWKPNFDFRKRVSRKNDSNDSFQNRYVNTFVHAFLEWISRLLQKSWWNSKFGMPILGFGSDSFNKNSL